jgi:ribonuclease-3
VEGQCSGAVALPQPCLRRAQAPAPRLPELRSVRRPPGPLGLISVTPVHALADDSQSPAGPEHGRRAAEWLRDALGIDLPDGLLGLALTHRSWAYENGNAPTNERLEFLGDSVLGLVVTDELYRSQPALPEGQLAKLRASVVNMTSLAGVARQLGDGGVGPHLLLGRGEETTGGRDKDSILADALEALIGAVHLGQGLDTAAAIVHRLFDPLLVEAATRGAGLDWKTSLQELGAARGLGAPSYETEDTGPDHAKTFTAAVSLAGTVYGTGAGRTKKAAEQEAAEAAWRVLSAGPE